MRRAIRLFRLRLVIASFVAQWRLPKCEGPVIGTARKRCRYSGESFVSDEQQRKMVCQVSRSEYEGGRREMSQQFGITKRLTEKSLGTGLSMAEWIGCQVFWHLRSYAQICNYLHNEHEYVINSLRCLNGGLNQCYYRRSILPTHYRAGGLLYANALARILSCSVP